MKKLSRTAIITAFIAAGTLSTAQVPGPPQEPPAQPSGPNGTPLTLTGCLVRSLSSNEYEIADTWSGEKYSFGAPGDLHRYFNQTVQLTGIVVVKGWKKSFRPESVASVAPSCEPAQ
jgi:hypothetical protein